MERFARAFQIGLGITALGALVSAVGWAGSSASEKCALGKLAAARAFTGCVLKAAERNLRKPGSGNDLCPIGPLRKRFEALEAKLGAEVCDSRRGLGFLLRARDYAEGLDLEMRPPKELLVYDAGPASGLDLWQGGPAAHCGPALGDDSPTCRRVPALAADPYQAPAFDLPSAFSFPENIPIRSVSGVQIAKDWDTFLNGTWDACLQTSPGPDCTTSAGVLPDGVRWWHGFDPQTGDELNCKDWSNPAIGAVSAYVGSSSTDGSFGHPSPWGPEEVSCNTFPEPPVHVLCLCF
jgi:hypothetical protein